MPWIQRAPETAAEKEIQKQGFVWFQTNTLGPSQEIGRHSHHGSNTHKLVRGKLTLTTLNDQRSVTLEEGHDTCTISRCVEYSGVAGPEGAQFVEGHMTLSPATAERFKKNGTIFWTEKETETEWFQRERKGQFNCTHLEPGKKGHSSPV